MEGTSATKSFIQIALSRSVVRRAAAYAVVVGSILIAINHGDAILRGDINGGRAAKMIVTTMVPYLVSTFSSVGAMRQAQRVERRSASAHRTHDASTRYE